MRWITLHIRQTASHYLIAIEDDRGRLDARTEPGGTLDGKPILAPPDWRRRVNHTDLVYLWPRTAPELRWEELARGKPLAWCQAPARASSPGLTVPVRLDLIGDLPHAWFPKQRGSHRWLRQADAIQFRVRQGPSKDADILVCDRAKLAAVVKRCEAMPLDGRPRLILTTKDKTEQSPTRPPAGMALYEFEPAPKSVLHGRFLDFLFQLAHNQLPAFLTGQDGRLHCSPGFLSEWKVADVSLQLEDTAAQYSALVRTGELLRERGFQTWQPKPAPLESLKLQFDRETNGIVPAGKTIAQLRHELAQLETSLTSSLGPASGRRREIEAQQNRSVDIALKSLDGDAPFVGRGTRPEPDTEYEVWVRIGQKFQETLFATPPPPIDPLLPGNSRGLLLEVVLYGKSCTVLGPRQQRLRLPRYGPTGILRFRLRTPPRGEPAEFRVALYFRNQLVQSYLVSTGAENGVAASIEFSLTEKFSNLAEFRKRPISLAINHDSGGTHRLMAKGRQPQELRLSETKLNDAPKQFRAFLEKATFDANGNRRFDSYPSGHLSDDFYALIREAATLGSDLYLELEARLEDLQPDLAAIRQSAETVIQIVQLGTEYVFPWLLLYDWTLPGDEAAPVCVGTNSAGGTCAHQPDDGLVFCLRGFWGIRNVIEQFLSNGHLADSPLEVAVDRSQAAVLLSVDEATRDFTALADELGTEVRPVNTTDDILKCLWPDNQPAPTLAILFGHVEKGPKIKLPGAGRYLSPRQIQDYARKAGKPMPPIFLLGCESAAIRVGGPHGFVDAVRLARAPVVIGTETLAFASLLARFGREVTNELWKAGASGEGGNLGQAILGFRRRLAAAGNPLPFVFQSFGRAEFHFRFKETKP